MWPTRSVTAPTLSPISSNDCWARWTVASLSSLRRAPAAASSAACTVAWRISSTMSVMRPAACWDSSASWRTSSATTAKPRPCSPARAASMAALRASRFVWSAILVIASVIPPMRSDMPASCSIIAAISLDDSRRAAIAAVTSRAASRPSRVTSPARETLSAVSRAAEAPSRVAAMTSSVALRIDSTRRTCCSAPWATLPAAIAISLTAELACSLVWATRSDAAATTSEPEAMSRSIAAVCSRIAL